MDRMLIATALRTGLTVITSDAMFATYGVTTVCTGRLAAPGFQVVDYCADRSTA